MEYRNNLSLHFKKRETALKWLAAGFAYFLLFAFMKNPSEFTISQIGKTHLGLFTVYCFIYGAAFLMNILYAYRTFPGQSKFLMRLAFVSNLCMGLVATTLMPLKASGADVTVFATIVHWITGFGNIIINAVVTLVFSLNISNQTKNKKLKACVGIGAATCIADLLAFAVLTVIMKNPQESKNGFFEIIPIVVSFLAIYIVNHTDLAMPRAQRDAAENKMTVIDTSAFSSLCWGLLIFAWISLSTYAFIRNPIHYTISMIALEYRPGFVVVSIAMAAAFFCNFLMMFKRHGYKNYFVIAVGLIGSLSIIPCVISPTTEQLKNNLVHSVFALMFFFFMMAAVLLFLIKQSKGNRKYRTFAVIQAAIFLASIVVLVILFVIFDQKYGRTGIVELVPLEYLFTFFMLENHTDYFKQSPEKEKIAVSAK